MTDHLSRSETSAGHTEMRVMHSDGCPPITDMTNTPPISSREARRQKRHQVALTRHEIIRLAGAIREQAEYIEELTAPGSALLLQADEYHARANELFSIADRYR